MLLTVGTSPATGRELLRHCGQVQNLTNDGPAARCGGFCRTTDPIYLPRLVVAGRFAISWLKVIMEWHPRHMGDTYISTMS